VTRFTIVTYNIHRGRGMDRRVDLDRIAGVLHETGGDVIGLQEVIRKTGEARADQAAYLARALDMDLVMGETRSYESGTYGNAVLTRLPIIGSARCDLSIERREPRGCLRVDIAVGAAAVHLFNLHLGLRMRERSRQLRLLGEFIDVIQPGRGPRVLVGDFNEWHPGPVMRRLRREFVSHVRRRARRTHPAVFPLFALDRIYWDHALVGEEIRVHRSRLARLASDHLPVVVTLGFRTVATF
jgi:endonuclease/exonuclease/phosphatase family metal-dependent hydrolase